MEVVLANGEVLQLGRAVQKTSSGYDLKDLFIGSGGTLGIITRLTLKLHPVPEHVHTLRVVFPDLRAAVQAAAAITASALPVARLELLDELGMQAINAALGRQYPEQPALFLEFHSSTAASIAAEAELAEELVNESGALAIDRAQTIAERDALWEARHKAYPALVSLFPDHRYLITDTAVPLSRIVELVTYAQDLLREMQLPGSIIGHVGDGNFHSAIAIPPDEYARASEYSDRLVTHALSLGGTASGEHGIGVVKRHFLAEEHGPALDWMRRVKALFDPDNLLNPGKDL
jgi:D-lactate dehydrogenase (cytochrome)